jgi:hypothetical protein
MRKSIFVLIAFFSGFLAIAQKNSDPVFAKRLDDYMRLTRELKFEELMEYTHPRIFEMASKEQLVEVFRQSFDNEQMKIRFDSTAITGISEDFKSNGVLYKKIDYWMSITVTLADTASTNNPGFITTMTTAFEQGFPGGTVEFDKNTKKFRISASSIMIAIKDNDTAPWMFLGYQKDKALLKQLYSQEVIDHFKLL